MGYQILYTARPQSEPSEMVRVVLHSEVQKLEEQIAILTTENEGLREREEVLLRRLQSHGDIETDKEEALRGEEVKDE